MTILQKMKLWLASFGRSEPLSLPTDGRSSVEKIGLNYSLTNFSGQYAGISPVISFEMLTCLKNLWLYHPEFSQHVQNLVNLANTGHQLTVNAKNEAAAERALDRLNETAARIYRNGAGVDGLINQELTSLVWSGACSTEDVVNVAARRIEKCVFVPVEDIRFRWEDEEWKPYQQVSFAGRSTKNGLIPLHPETYRYFAIETIDNSPYAKPPATAAVQAITEMQQEVIDNVKYIVNKFSILGLLSVMVRRLTRKPTETEGEFNLRSQKYLGEVRDSLSGSFNKGLLVAFDNMQFKGDSVAANGSGFYDVYRVIAETFMSGLGQQPAFFGRTDSTTETYADVVYQLLLSRAHNFQRIAKRRRERTYRFDLRLGGVEVDGVSLKFNKSFSRNTLAEAQADEIRVRTALDKARAGIISADQAAQELGYESAFDPAILEEGAALGEALGVLAADSRVSNRFHFRFAKESQRYEFIRPRIGINLSGARDDDDIERGNVVPIKKKQSAFAG
ncbi:MAG: hypothetical protein KIS76_03890 [Pyrinomonadaceae bacterium]|nr:hypothetical protein [Pyrinomonadaceae bacterium]